MRDSVFIVHVGFSKLDPVSQFSLTRTGTKQYGTLTSNTPPQRWSGKEKEAEREQYKKTSEHVIFALQKREREKETESRGRKQIEKERKGDLTKEK